MKRISLLALSLATCALMSAGLMFGCASTEESGSQAVEEENLTEYQKILQANSLENLAGADGSFACNIETYGEDSVLEDTMAISWSMSEGKPNLSWVDTFEDGIQYANTAYSGDNCGALYTIEDGEKSATIYGQNDFSESITDEWTTMIEYEGTESEVKMNGDEAILHITQEATEDSESYEVSTFTFDPNTYLLHSVETNVYSSENDAVEERIVIKDITPNQPLDLQQNPYQLISEIDDAQACALTVVIHQPDGEQITSSYKVARDAYVDLAIAEDFEIYSDEAMSDLIEEVDVTGESATVYVQVRDTSDEDATAEDDGTTDLEDALTIGSDEPGQEFVSEDGAVLTLGEDGQLYDEAGNVVELDTESE